MADATRLGLRWTIGDVNPRGFEALRLSVWGAWRLFGPGASYAICVNSITPENARRRTGPLPGGVVWHTVGRDDLPLFLRSALDGAMAEGAAWKFAPLRLFPDRYELALDNDCILWGMPDAITRWLEEDDPDGCILAEDVKACFGQFADLCGPEPRNAGIRGLPPDLDLGAALRAILEMRPIQLGSELDEQGLEVAAMSRRRPPWVVRLDEVAICSPFPPHLPRFGSCGAHFVGLNTRSMPWTYYDRPATECIAENWDRLRPELYRAVGLSAPDDTASQGLNTLMAGPAAR